MGPSRGVSALSILMLLASPAGAERRIRDSEFTTPQPAPPGSLIVVGFLGAWEVWDNPKRSVRKVALKLRGMRLPGVYVETAGNHSRSDVRRFLKRALDQNSDGSIDAQEAGRVGVVLYGQSFGGAAAVKLARELKKWNVPVRLTVQVDSIGRDDEVIPSNVKRALNLYQRDPGSIWGQNEIRPENPAQTQILGNQRFVYLFRFDIDMSDYPKAAQKAPVAHWKMDNDPVVWGIVEGAILAEFARWQAERQ
jgi:pimeloyl-ACP methyl ester carboxylesterase